MTPITRIVLAKRPVGEVTLDCFRVETAPLPPLEEGEVEVRALYLSLDPYMRPRMSELRSYVPAFALDRPLTAGVVGEVVASRHGSFAKGDVVLGMLDWAERTIVSGKLLRKLDPSLAPLPAYLGVLGMPGYTAYHGMMRIGRPEAGETVFVSAATGAVGQVAAQLAKLAGARVVGCAGSKTKCDHAVSELGYDACFDHRERAAGDALDELCPKGIDLDFENVGGEVFHAAFARMNDFGRIVMCGAIAEYQDPTPRPGPDKMFTIIQRRLRIEGFIISDHQAGMGEFLQEVGPLVREGTIRANQTIVEGLGNAPSAFLGLLAGENLGKLVVRVG